MKEKKLKKGYTTGVFASFAFKSALEAFLATKTISISKTNKNDNDDLDVTKGCEIVVTISSKKCELELNKVFQEPHTFEHRTNKISIYSGVGVGVVTKKGLKIAQNFPAINPKPLEEIEKIFKYYTKYSTNLNMYCSVSVTDGEEISKSTANSKVGVLGGISILGTTGIVKPISSTAYLDSIKTEIEFANSNAYELLVFTLGNSSFLEAKKRYNKEQIIEIGNFVYDSIKIAKDLKVNNILFLCGIGKMTKVYQGFKNTHNRFGVIDFKRLQNDINENLKYNVDIESTKTVKGICEELNSLGKAEDFYRLIEQKANNQIKKWFDDITVDAVILEEKKVSGW